MVLPLQEAMKRKAPRRPHQSPVVKERKLGREKAWGLAHPNGLIEIDPRVSGLGKLELLTHEFFHLENWEATERDVTRRSRKLARFLHRNRVRIIEEGNRLLP